MSDPIARTLPAGPAETFGCLGAPTKAELLTWRGMLLRGEIRPRGFTQATALAYLDEQLARCQDQERN